MRRDWLQHLSKKECGPATSASIFPMTGMEPRVLTETYLVIKSFKYKHK